MDFIVSAKRGKRFVFIVVRTTRSRPQKKNGYNVRVAVNGLTYYVAVPRDIVLFVNFVLINLVFDPNIGLFCEFCIN